MSSACTRSLVIILAVTGLAGLPAAHGVNVTNQTTGTLLFGANFESDAVGANPSATLAGSWGTADYTAADIQVSNASLPGAAQGSNYLRIPRATGGTYVVGSLASAQSTPGDRIHFESMVYIPAYNDAGAPNPAFGMQLFFRPGDPVLLSSGSISGGTGAIYYYAGGHQLSGLKFTADKWQKWAVDFAVGASTFDLTVDGQTASGLTAGAPINDISLFFFGNGSPNSLYFVDAVPEPATLAMLAAGVFLVRRRRR